MRSPGVISKISNVHGDMARKLDTIEHQIGFNNLPLKSKAGFTKIDFIDLPLPHYNLVPLEKQTASGPRTTRPSSLFPQMS